ncbi:MAG: hypothetical protein ACYTFY_08855 [Planctomycetota bacterium]|jgi:hypothetical protein
MKLIISIKLIVISLLFLVGCNKKNTSQNNQNSENPPPYLKCIGQFKDYDADYPWFESWTEKDGRSHHGDGNSPMATFKIVSPTIYNGRIVGVLYKYEGKNLSAPPQEIQKGNAFTFEVPEDYFLGKYKTIDNIHVRNFRSLRVDYE